MKPKLIVIFLLIVLAPLGLLAWLGVRLAHNEQEVVQERFRELLTGRLEDTKSAVAKLIEKRERELLAVTEMPTRDAAAIREALQKNPVILQIFVLDPKGNRLHPPKEGPLNASEQEFLQRAAQIWKDKHVFFQSSQEQATPSRWSQGWYVWYWGEGINLAFWRRDATGHVIGVEVNRPRLLADIVAEMPDTGAASPLPEERICLVDGNGAVLYQWGAYQPPKDEKPRAELALAPPLSSWKLAYLAPASAVGKAFGRGEAFSLISGMVAVALALIGLGVYFYRDNSREMREASQRMSFVNQVSHELKTPLTNIRMYAELLEQDLSEGEEKARQHLGVVVSESQRLSRLINNVLAFSRKQRGKLTLHKSAGRVDAVVAAVIESFRPALQDKGVRTEFVGEAGATVQFDPDGLEQILGNLFSNVEKYAASGGWMRVASRQEGDRTVIAVADKGPGIPESQREKIFEPFHRLSNKLTDGVAGTGIGLAIARDLARMHGGDLRLTGSEAGACFEITLHTPMEAKSETQ